MQSLQTLISVLSKNRKLHISILDLRGVLNTESTVIQPYNAIHSKNFCSIAKSTDKGYRLCLRCKLLANTKAITTKTSFSGHCLYGLYEAAVPLVINGAVAAVVYVGNAVIDGEFTQKRIEKICRYTGVNREMLCSHVEQCEHLSDPKELIQIGEILRDYLKILYEKAPRSSTKSHWLVEAMKRHAIEAYRVPVTLKELAAEYHKNEKYMGRLWRREMGMGFHEYCTALRLERAEELLRESDEKVLDIALECGFNNISYFNRVFYKKHGISPTAYRRSH